MPAARAGTTAWLTAGRLPSVWPRLGGDLARGGFDRGSGCLEVAGRRRASRAPRAGSAARRARYGGGGRVGRRGGRRPVVVVRPAAGDRLGGGRVSGLPSGAVTFLFSDIEGSTRLVKALRERYPQVLAEHRRLIRAAVVGQAGYEVDTQGDAFFVAFAGAKQAVLCALEVQQALAGHQWPAGALVRVRIGIHTGHAVPAEGAYAGLAVHRAARICAAAVGGQLLVSQATQTIIEDEEEQPGFTLVDLGERTLKDLDRPVRLFQLAAPGLDTGTPRPGGSPAAGRRRERRQRRPESCRPMRAPPVARPGGRSRRGRWPWGCWVRCRWSGRAVRFGWAGRGRGRCWRRWCWRRAAWCLRTGWLRSSGGAARRRARRRRCGRMCHGCERRWTPMPHWWRAGAAMCSDSILTWWMRSGSSSWSVPGRRCSAEVRRPPRRAVSGRRWGCGGAGRWLMCVRWSCLRGRRRGWRSCGWWRWRAGSRLILP